MNKTIAKNKKAYHDYFVEETYEAGLALKGTEVKSLRAGKVNLKDSYCAFDRAGELWTQHMHVSPYEQGNIFNADPLRPRKLLLHKAELKKLADETQQQGLTLIPLSLYFSNGRVKMQVGLCRGKKNYDKRADIAKKDAQREIERTFRDRQRT